MSIRKKLNEMLTVELSVLLSVNILYRVVSTSWFMESCVGKTIWIVLEKL